MASAAVVDLAAVCEVGAGVIAASGYCYLQILVVITLAKALVTYMHKLQLSSAAPCDIYVYLCVATLQFG